MRTLLILALALTTGCTPTEPGPIEPGTVDMTVMQNGWPSFSDDLDYALESQRQRAILSQSEFDETKERQRDWWAALVLFDDFAALKIYYDAGYWDEFIEAVYWSADDRGHAQDRRDAKAYDDIVRGML